VTPSPLIRDAVPEDAEPLGHLHAAAWQAAYADQIPTAYLETVTAARRVAMWHRILATPRTDGERIQVAVTPEDGTVGSVVGFAHTGPCRDDDSTGLGELFAINVGPEAWGTGAGPALLNAAHVALHAAGFTTAILWVLPGNARARAFYERHGWHADGHARTIPLGGEAGSLDEIRYARQIGDQVT